jgi:hypothetical protein
MNETLKHLSRFLLLGLLQILLFSNLNIGLGIQLLIYPIFIFLLPTTLSIFYSMLLAFALGIVIDISTGNFGLHASSAVFIAYIRPIIFKYFAPRDGYESSEETNFFVMGPRWFIFAYFTFLLFHCLWFFMLENFKLNDLLFVFQKAILSVPFCFILALVYQFIFIRKPIGR